MFGGDDTTQRSVLLYDGSCAFCGRAVRLILRNDRKRTLLFAAIESPFARRIVEARPDLRDAESVIWVDLDSLGTILRAHARSEAALRIVGYLGGWWSLLLACRIVPRSLRDRVYGFVARHRRRIPGGVPCFVPSPEQKRRFLTTENP